MIVNYSTTKGAGDGTNVGPGPPLTASWNNPTNIEVNDSTYTDIGFFSGGQHGDTLIADNFVFDIPTVATIDGIEVHVRGNESGCLGLVRFGNDTETIGTLNKTYGSPVSLWGDTWTPDTIDSNSTVSIELMDLSGGDGYAQVEYISITVYWHLDISTPPTDVPTRVDYKIFARDGTYLGLLPNVTSEPTFSQDINTAGSTMDIKSAQDLRDVTHIEPLLTESGIEILTESGHTLLTEETNIFITTATNDDYALFKNSNRIEVWLYNYWYPNGNRIFKGQINKITFSYGGDSGDTVNMLVYSDGFDLANYIARGLPASLTSDVSQVSQNGFFTSSRSVSGEYIFYGQTWKTGGSTTNIGALSLYIQGTANIVVSIYDSPGGNLLGTTTRNITSGTPIVVQFTFEPIIEVIPNTSYFFTVTVGVGQTIYLYKHSLSSTYIDGTAYELYFAGGSGTPWSPITGDLYFITYIGTLTTTATFTSDDPVTDMASNILLDYNKRGGYVVENSFDPTGLSITYTWIMSSIYEVLKKIIELSPFGWYYYIDLGNALIDIKQANTVADFIVVSGRDIHKLDISLSTEQVTNQLLLTGGDTGGSNLYRAYTDTVSVDRYGLRTHTKTDNRITIPATADAIGSVFIAENAEETQETKITILNSTIDITLLTPGKTIGFVNFGHMVDGFILQIVRREYTPDATTVTLGRLPINLPSNIQAINRGLLNEQTVNNPGNPN